MESVLSVWSAHLHCEGETGVWWSGHPLLLPGEQFPILQVLNPQEAFSSPLIKSHSSKLLTCIPHEVHIKV